MKHTLLPIMADLFTGIVVVALSLLVFANFANDSLLVFYIVTTCLVFISSIIRGKVSTIKPSLSFLLLNAGLIFLTLDEFIKSLNPLVFLQLLPVFLVTAAGLYLGRCWHHMLLTRKNVLITAPLPLACLCYVLTITPIANALYTVKIDEPSPAFKLPIINGNIVDIQSLKGKVVVLNFGVVSGVDEASTGKTLKALPKLAKVYENYQNNPDVAFFFVNVSNQGESGLKTLEQTAAFAQNSAYKFPFAYDFEGIRHYFRTYSLPAMIILDKSGNVRVKRYGYFQQRALEFLLTEDIERLR